jgi:DNA-binding PadR family transcriptional regulator
VFQRQGTRAGESIKMIALNDLMVGEKSFRADELNAALQSMADKGWIDAGRNPGFYTLTELGFKQLNPQRKQQVQDFVNLERPIQDFLGWALALDQEKFVAVLEHDGHHAPTYHAEKWQEFQQNKLAFLWNWTPAFVSAWADNS